MDAAARVGPGVQPLRADGPAALLAAAVRPRIEPRERLLAFVVDMQRLLQQRSDLLALDGDGGAFRVVLVVGVAALGRRDQPGQLTVEVCEPGRELDAELLQPHGPVHRW